jgi:hypothetical protein
VSPILSVGEAPCGRQSCRNGAPGQRARSRARMGTIRAAPLFAPPRSYPARRWYLTEMVTTLCSSETGRERARRELAHLRESAPPRAATSEVKRSMNSSSCCLGVIGFGEHSAGPRDRQALVGGSVACGCSARSEAASCRRSPTVSCLIAVQTSERQTKRTLCSLTGYSWAGTRRPNRRR